MTDDDALTAAGGWCAPAELHIPIPPVPDFTITIPSVQASRSVITYETTPAQKAAAAINRRIADRYATARRHAIDTACATALTNGWDVHVYEPPTPYDVRHADAQQLLYLRSVGIAFTPAQHPVPTLHHHPAPTYWDDDED